MPLVGAAADPPLPVDYGADLIILQVRDPRWLHAYWELKPSTIARARAQLRARGLSAHMTLRVSEEGTSRFFDVDFAPGAMDWFIEVDPPHRAWRVEIGLRDSRGRFASLARSNRVNTPLEGARDPAPASFSGSPL